MYYSGRLDQNTWRDLARENPEMAFAALGDGSRWMWGGDNAFHRVRSQIKREVLQLWRLLAEKDSEKAIRLTALLTGEERSEVSPDVPALWDELAARNPSAALEVMGSLRVLEMKRSTTDIQGIWKAHAEGEPIGSLSIIGTLSKADREALRDSIVETWKRASTADMRFAFNLLNSFDAAERAALKQSICSSWIEWSVSSPGQALPHLGQMRSDERLAVSPAVPSAWEAMLTPERIESAFVMLEWLLPSERARIMTRVAQGWKELAKTSAWSAVQKLRQLAPEEIALLTADIQEAWASGEVDYFWKLHNLSNLSPAVRAGLTEKVRETWRAAAEKDLERAVGVMHLLSLEERAGLPSAAAVDIFRSGEALPKGSDEELAEDVVNLWRGLEPVEALSWLSRVKAGLRDLVPSEEQAERWEAALEKDPKVALAWIDNVPLKIRPELGAERLVRLLGSEKAEVRLWAITQAGTKAAEASQKQRKGRGR